MAQRCRGRWREPVALRPSERVAAGARGGGVRSWCVRDGPGATVEGGASWGRDPVALGSPGPGGGGTVVWGAPGSGADTSGGGEWRG